MKHTHGTHCQNCGEAIYVPDNRTGLIHEHGKYACYADSEHKVRLETVAE